jgi:Ion transport protein
MLSTSIYGAEEEKKTVMVESNSQKLLNAYYEVYSVFHAYVFPGLPEHYPLKKKLIMTKAKSYFGTVWDINQIMLALLACAMYVAELSVHDYDSLVVYSITEIVITQFFLVDFLFNWFVSHSSASFFTEPLVIVDIITIAPVYIGLFVGNSKNANLSIFRFIRILRLVRILRAFRVLRGLSGIQKQMITLVLTLLSLIFLASGVIQLFENDVKQQMELSCNYINAATNWRPSCSEYEDQYDR